MTYSFKTTLLKMVKYFVAFALPAIVDRFIVSYPAIAQLTVGTILLGILNWLKARTANIAAGQNKSWTRFIP